MPNNDSKTYIVNDQPTEIDALDFTPYVETLADIIQTGNTPLTIGVFGTWGSGKTSLMKMVKKELPNDFTLAWFDAWKYDKEESLWRAFLLCVLSALKDRASLQGKPVEEFEKLQSLVYSDMEIEKVGGVTIDLAKLGGVTAKGLAQLSLSFIPGLSALTKLVEELQSGAAKSVDEATAAIRRERTKIYIEQIQFLEQFQNRFRELVQEHVKPNRLVVFVDDLDRCLPEKAIEVLEAIKLFLDAENCVFMLGLDQEVIARGIEMKYKELGAKQDGDNQQHFTVEGVRYLEKIIQLPFQIPPVEKSDMGDFVQQLSAEWPHEECPRVFAVGLGDNPRQIKRTVNTFLMLWKLAGKRKIKLQERIKPIRLAKIVTIQAVYPELYELLKENPIYLRNLQEYYWAEEKFIWTGDEAKDTFVKAENKTETRPGRLPDLQEQEKDDSLAWLEGLAAAQDDVPKTPQVDLPPILSKFASKRFIRRLLIMHPPKIPDANFVYLSTDDIRLYFTLTRRTETTATTSNEKPKGFYEPQTVEIPAGEFLMGSTEEQISQLLKTNVDIKWIEIEQPSHTVDLPEYYIGKHPITNREYELFINETNYKPPIHWDGNQYPSEKGDHPVIHVSWEDAVAYCEWLSKKTEKPYRLPTEAEWEKAARGVDGRIYPWGNDFSKDLCNTQESRRGETVSVDNIWLVLSGVPYDCLDMVGNAWEWCADWFDSNEYKKREKQKSRNPKGPEVGSVRVLRGGSYLNSYVFARCATRNGSIPTNRQGIFGFRIALSQQKTNDRKIY